jgi:hypothetical protein
MLQWRRLESEVLNVDDVHCAFLFTKKNYNLLADVMNSYAANSVREIKWGCGGGSDTSFCRFPCHSRPAEANRFTGPRGFKGHGGNRSHSSLPLHFDYNAVLPFHIPADRLPLKSHRSLFSLRSFVFVATLMGVLAMH